MTVDFALFVSPEGIALAHRQPQGHWALVGEVPFATQNLSHDMAVLKETAVARGGTAQTVLVVLPDDQILYTSLTAPTEDRALVEARIVASLDGLTPYAVADLVYDWRAVEADRVKVAVIARETLDEAESFITEHGFESAGFSAMPPVERFPGMPVFGTARPDLPDLATGMAFGPDHWVAPIADLAPVDPGAPVEKTPDAATGTDEASAAPAKAVQAATEDAKTDPKPALDDAPPPEAGPAQQEDLFSAQANTLAPTSPVETLAKDASPEPEQATEPEPEAAQTLTGPDKGKADTAQPDATTAQETAAEADAAPEGPEGPERSAFATIIDATLDRPIAPILEVGTDSDAERPAPSLDPDAERTGPKITDASGPEPKASRGKIARPTTDKRSLAASKADAAPAGKEPDTPTPQTAQNADLAQAEDAARAEPSFGFAARRGRVAKPDADAGKLVSDRSSRLGLGRPNSDARPLHPDVTSSRATASVTDTAPTAPTAAARPISKLAAQLARVRDASKARQSPSSPTPPDASAPDAPGPDSAQTPQAAADTDTSASAKSQTLQSGADAAIKAGLLGRKTPTASGPSLRMGMILTLILILLLALIAIWSVLFLPNSPVARIFGGTATPLAEELEDATLDAQTASAMVPDPRIADAPSPTANDPPPAQAPTQAPAQAPTPAPTTAATAPQPDAIPPSADPALPDIDADFDLPPLPGLAEDALPSLEETEQLYAQEGIWLRPPEPPYFSPFTLSDDIIIAAIDPEVLAFDAVALADPRINPTEVLRAVPPPPAFGARIDRDARGLVIATAEGVLTPEGAFVVLGRPATPALPRPREMELEQAALQQPAFDLREAVLGGIRPAARPSDLDETRERQILGGLSVRELAGMRPTERPVSIQDGAAQASLFPQADAAETPGAAAPAILNATARAIEASRLPVLRPSNIATIVAEAQSAPAPTQVAAAIAPPPSIPSNANVSRAATNRNVIRLRDINLIGVSGTPSNRSALVRLPSGRFVRVSVGDRLDGGRVAAIGENSLQYVINGRNVTLDIPG